MSNTLAAMRGVCDYAYAPHSHVYSPPFSPQASTPLNGLPTNRIDDILYLVTHYATDFFHAWLVSLSIAGIAFAGGFLLAIALTVARVSPIVPAHIAVNAYVEIFRNAPVLTILFFLYYALPYLGIVAGEATVVIWALILVSSAFACDNLRSGINSVAPGEIEAGRALGLSFTQILRLIVLPQALRTVIPPMTSLLVMVTISSSTGALLPLAHQELTGLVNSINTTQALGIATFTVAAAFYVGTALLIGYLGGRLEKRLTLPSGGAQ